MRLIYTLVQFIAFVMLTTIAKAQTCSGVSIGSQESLEEFGAMGCQHINGNLYIGGSVTDLIPLLNLRTISGNLWIAASSLKNLQGLNNLDSIGDFLRIYYNDSLETLAGLEKLRIVGNYIDINANDTLHSISALSSLESARSLTVIAKNLRTVGTFPQLQTIRGNLKISGDSIIHVDGFNQLKKVVSIDVGGLLTETISGFNKVDTLTSLSINGFPNLRTVSGFQSLRHVREGLLFSVCPNLVLIPEFPSLNYAKSISFSCKNLEKIPELISLDSAGSISFGFLDKIDSIPPFPNLKSLKSFGATSVNQLRNLNHFHNIPDLLSVNLRQNPLLETVDMGRTTTSMNSIDIVLNPTLKLLSGFDQLSFIKEIHISANENLLKIPSFPNLTKAEELIYLQELGLKNIEGFYKLDSVGVKLVGPTAGLYIHDMPDLTRITGFDSLRYAHSFRIQDALTLDTVNAFGQFNLITLNFTISETNLEALTSFNSLREIEGEIFIRENPSLVDISALDSVNLTELNKISLTDNLELQSCNTFLVCSALDQGKPNLIKNNDTYCNTRVDVLQQCTGIYSHIYAEVFYDLNQNGVRDSGEPLFPSSRIHILPENSIYFSHQSNGLSYYVDYGEYRVSSSITEPEKWMVTTIDTFDVLLSETNIGDTLRFGYFPLELVENVKPFQTSSRTNCNTLSTLVNTVKNFGTTISEGILWVKVDHRMLDVDLNSPDFQTGDLFGYHFKDLFPGHTRTFPIQFTVPGPDEIMLGTPVHFSAFIENITSGDTSSYYYNPIMACAYDPNDKQTNPVRVYDQTLFEEDLHYTIRFENTGNLEATDIIIRDTLDAHLDPNSVEIVSSSHLNRLETTINENILTFYFKNIYLPWFSYDSGGTQGYVSFIVKPFRPIEENTIVENNASIYFDLNPPIITNVTSNRYLSELWDVCIANAGNDTALCTLYGLDTFYLGGQPTASGGTGPYTYKWSASYEGFVKTYTASFFLDDTTSANPRLMQPVDGPVTFCLEVMDSLGIMCFDSITIEFSWWITTLDVKDCQIVEGDSCQLYTSVYEGIPPLSYSWTPITGLANPHDVFTMASPDTTTTYTLLVTDSAGCQAEDLFYVFVIPVGLDENKEVSINMILYPNPALEEIILDIKYELTTSILIEIINTDGQTLISKNIFTNDLSRMSVAHLIPGLYIVKATNPEKMSTIRFVKM